MRGYVTLSPPCPARTRVKDEDFSVEELLDLKGLSTAPAAGYYPLYLVRKKGIDTLHMERELSIVLRSRVSIGGIKDKRASAAQYVTPTSKKAESAVEIQREGFSAKLIGYLPKPVSRGSIVGNRFNLILRDCCPDIRNVVNEVADCAAQRKIPNYYGTQRFGTGAGSHRVGEAIVRRRFKEAVDTILGGEESSDYEELLNALSPGQDTERKVAGHLARKPSDFVGALREIPIRLRRLFVHAYQSYIFNLTLSLALEQGLDVSKFKEGDNWAELSEDGLTVGRPRGVRDHAMRSAVPLIQLPGFAHRDYGSRFDVLLGKVMFNEGVGGKDFYVREMEEVSAEGGFRLPFQTVKDFSGRYGGSSATLAFSLGRGQYATVLLREIIKR